ncbi:amino acid adenylation domain-containing protein [Gordonia sp. CPCC 205515]|uniref:amino acid adenylation domain-containing protein n=1 Tax=Gordonia sp. CPCC 205515 TaxID=3140791 RepID=UPI003AF3DD8E
MTSRSTPHIDTARSGAAMFGLSAAQSELWLAQQLHPSVPFSISHYIDLHGPVDTGLLEECTRQAGRELQSPLARFAIDGGVVRQHVHEGGEGECARIDVSDLPDPAQAAHAWMSRDRLRGADPTVGDEINRAAIFTLGPDRYLCYGRSHHLAIDGYGAGQVLRRTAELYSAAETGIQAPPNRAMRLSDIVAIDQRYRSSARFGGDRDYWRENLAGLDRVTRLSERFAAPSATPIIARATIDPSDVRSVEIAARRTGVGLAEILIATLAALLARMTGNADVTVSLPVAARTSAALRRSAGMVSNVVPIRIPDVARSTIDELIATTRLSLIGALRHQLYRHEDVLRDIGVGVAGRSGYGPLINILTFPEHITFGSAVGRAHLLSAGPVDDMTINCYRFGAGSSLTVEFFANPELYTADQINGYLRQFIDGTSDIVRASGAENVFDVVGSGSRIGEATSRRRSHPRLLPDLLADGVGAGDRIAIRGPEGVMTYRELDERSARWACELIAHGAGPEVIVAVALPRSVHSVTALWAVARAGAVFFPMDPDGPAARVSKLLTDSRATLGMTVTARLASLACATVDWLVLDSEEFTAAAGARPVTAVTDAHRTRPLHTSHSAYLIYTSGSTGDPKGVLTTHEALATLADDLVSRYGLSSESVVPQTHSPYCDASMLEYLSAFAVGAELVVPEPDIVAGERLSRLLEDSAVTHLLVTPNILATLDPRRLVSLQAVAVGGEKCPPTLVGQWSDRVAMFNSYGPTESTVVVTQTEPLRATESVPIGRALPGVQLCVLDARLRPVPRGARGELYLAGDSLARGYLGQPAVTAQSFVSNPFGAKGSRMYRTGDVVRRQLDGNLEYLGRSDAQISLRGQRIEPSEVERTLMADPAIDQAAVRVWTSEELGDRLIGYLTTTDDAPVDRHQVLVRLRKILPPAMIPAMLVELPELPINPSSGKIDRSALPDPTKVPRPGFRAPRTTHERTVADAIADITGATAVGLDDNFFELGGNSLLGVELCRRLSESTETSIPVSMLFTPTVQSLSEAIDALATEGNDERAVTSSALQTVLPLRCGENHSATPLICLPSAVPLSWCYSGLVSYVADRPIYGLQSPMLGSDHRCSTVEDLAEMYRIELTRVHPRGPYHLLGWSLGGQLAHALAIALRADGRDVDLVVMLDTVTFGEGTPAPQPPTIRDLVTHLQGNESETPDTTPLSLAGAVDVLAHTAGPGRGLTRAQVEGLHHGYVDGVGMSTAYRPAQRTGDLLYFSARRGVTTGLTAEMWRPYVTGTIIEHEVEVTHAQMTNPEALAVIGPLLDAELNRRS